MSNLIENNFCKISDTKYIAVNRQIGFAIMGGIGFITILYATIETTCKLSNEFGFRFYYLIFFGIGIIILGSMFLLFIAMGLFTVTTEINLASRTVRIIRRNFRGQQPTQEAPLDSIRINAINMGVTDATPYGAWIVKAGFFFENDAGEECDTAIWSKEVTAIDERNKIMLELYQFFFPNRPAVNESNIITKGTAVMLLSNSEKAEFETESNAKNTPDNGANTDKSKWDKLL